MSFPWPPPDPPLVRDLQKPSGCCCCADLYAAPKPSLDYTFNTFDGLCAPIVQTGSFPFFTQSDCTGLIDVSMTNCGASPFGCGGLLSNIAGSTYMYRMLFTAGSTYVDLMIKPDLTADIFASFPANSNNSGFCSDCPWPYGDIWAAYDVAISYGPDCSVTVPETALSRILACGTSSTSLSVSIG
jgi:hypothetical protein